MRSHSYDDEALDDGYEDFDDEDDEIDDDLFNEDLDYDDDDEDDLDDDYLGFSCRRGRGRLRRLRLIGLRSHRILFGNNQSSAAQSTCEEYRRLRG